MPKEKTIMDYLAENIKQTVTLKKLVQLFGEGITIVVKDSEGHKTLTPYLLTMLGDEEAYSISIYDLNRVVISLQSPEKEGAQHV